MRFSALPPVSAFIPRSALLQIDAQAIPISATLIRFLPLAVVWVSEGIPRSLLY